MPSRRSTKRGGRRRRSTAGARAPRGRFEEAFELFRAAAEHTTDPRVWLELGDITDRLRLDPLALQAYKTFIERLPDASSRSQVEGRIRVLEHHRSGGSHAVAQDGHSVNAFVDWNGPATARRPTQNVIMDWQGNPQSGEHRRELLSLADWDGAMRAPRPNLAPPPHPRPLRSTRAGAWARRESSRPATGPWR